jgi:tRNA pseudouridine38-40 synthase
VPRFALEMEYDGSLFVGWQRQRVGVSVQAVLEQAASRLVGGAAVASVAAGRTDAGVHAAAMVVQIDLDRDIAPDKLRDALNYHMQPHAVAVLRAATAATGWNARFSATGRTYRYRILNRDARPALERQLVWHVREALDADAMHRAAQALVGRHDFTSFRAASCQAKSPLRTLDALEVERHGAIVEITARARSFLHHQVRNMVGSLKLVGAGRWEVDRVAEALAACRRDAAGPTAPPQGLCLIGVSYPEAVFT